MLSPNGLGITLSSGALRNAVCCSHYFILDNLTLRVSVGDRESNVGDRESNVGDRESNVGIWSLMLGIESLMLEIGSLMLG